MAARLCGRRWRQISGQQSEEPRVEGQKIGNRFSPFLLFTFSPFTFFPFPYPMTFDLLKMPDVPRHQRQGRCNTDRSDPEIVLPDLLVAGSLLQARAQVGISLNCWLGFQNRYAQSKKLPHSDGVMTGTDCTVPEFPKHDPWQSKTSLRIIHGKLRRPRLPPPQSYQKGGVSYEVHGSLFAVDRCSIVASKS